MIIYSVINLINNKTYIGQTTRKLSVRINEHQCFAFKKQSLDIFHRALRKYGKENFKWKILGYFSNQKKLNKMEIFYIKKYKTDASAKTGYNIRKGGSNGKLSEETKFKISQKHKNKKHTKETKEKISLKTRGNKNPRYIHLTIKEKMDLYNDFINCNLTNKELERKYNMSRPTLYRKIKEINPNLGKNFKDKRYRALTPKRRVLS